MKPYPCIETTHDITVGDYLIRLWINQTEIRNDYYEDGIERYVKENFRAFAFSEGIIKDFLKGIPNLNAIQIKNLKTNRGTVIYTVDFAEDVHG